MILKDYVALLSANITAVLLKTVRLNMNETVANYIQKNGLYHFTKSLETAELIKQSGMIKQSGKFASLGSNITYLFAGVPDIELYNKNLGYGAYSNLLLNPEKILYAVKLNINKEQLSNYKIRIQDGAIVHEGNCILRDDQVEIKQMVLDLIQDKNGQKKLGLRERTEQEKAEDKENKIYINGELVRIPGIINKHKPSQECKTEIEKEKKRVGLSGRILLADIETAIYNAKIDEKKSSEAAKSILQNLETYLKNIINPKHKTIDENPSKKIKRILQNIQCGTIDTKKSVRSKTYTNAIIELNKQGKTQRSSYEVMNSLHNNNYYQYASEKEKTLDVREFPNSKIHGINHGRRVAILASAIMNDLGLNFDERITDILITAAYKHDIGRILDVGPHARRGVKKLRNIDLRHADGEEYSEEDRKLLYFLVEGHETSDKKIDRLLHKYGIAGEEKANKYKLYLDIIKDADALDRAD